jgi:hypothetical protein
MSTIGLALRCSHESVLPRCPAVNRPAGPIMIQGKAQIRMMEGLGPVQLAALPGR